MSQALARKIEHVPVDRLTPHPNNPNVGDVGAIAESIHTVGFYAVIYAQKSTGRIIAGEHRWKAAQTQGMTTVPVVWLDVDDEQAVRIMVADNEIPRRRSVADDPALADLLAQLAETPAGLSGTGWEDAELGDLLAQIKRDQRVLGTDEVTEPPETPATQPGDLWILGEHRLLCGDATRAEDYAILLDGGSPGAIFADPPYGMDLDPDYAGAHGSVGHRSNRYRPVIGDDRPFDAARIIGSFDAVGEQFWWGADYYRGTIESGGSWVVWDKRESEHGLALDAVHGAQFELCWSRQPHKREIARILWSGHHGMQGEDAKTRLHPTQKPTALAEWFFERWVKPEVTVLDPFGGSGTTLIACEQTGRRARLLEIDPGYCDVIARRFQNLSGIVPLRDGEPHDFLG